MLVSPSHSLLPCTDNLQGDSDTMLSLWHRDDLLQPYPKAGELGLQGSLRADAQLQ